MFYHPKTILDFGGQPQAAMEIQGKMMSRQTVAIHSGKTDASFDMDKGANICKEINQKALDAGMAMASSEAKNDYAKYGKKLVLGDDYPSEAAGPLWIAKNLEFNDNNAKTETEVRSRTTVIASDSRIFPGSHYCKLLSPYRVLEWIYLDSQYDHRGRTSSSQNELQMLLVNLLGAQQARQNLFL